MQIPEEKASDKNIARAFRLVLTGGQGRPLGVAILVALLALSLFPSLPAVSELRMALFDGYQKLAPRKRASAPAVIVAIDEKSLQELGQWPWPRTTVAELIEAIAKSEPAAIGVDVLMPEAAQPPEVQRTAITTFATASRPIAPQTQVATDAALR